MLELVVTPRSRHNRATQPSGDADTDTTDHAADQEVPQHVRLAISVPSQTEKGIDLVQTHGLPRSEDRKNGHSCGDKKRGVNEESGRHKELLKLDDLAKRLFPGPCGSGSASESPCRVDVVPFNAMITEPSCENDCKRNIDADTTQMKVHAVSCTIDAPALALHFQVGERVLTIHNRQPNQPNSVNLSLRISDERMAEMTTESAPIGVWQVNI